MDGFLKCICYLAIIGIAAFLLGRILPQKWFHYDRVPWCMRKLKPGGLSVTEAAVKKLPMALINASGSCSRKEN